MIMIICYCQQANSHQCFVNTHNTPKKDNSNSEGDLASTRSTVVLPR